MTLVAQRPTLFQTTLYENIAIGLRFRKVKEAKIREEVMRVLEQVDLAGKAKQPAYTLSGGEIQRAALARALVLKPKLLLLDEATANLDPTQVEIIEEVIRSENRERQTTILFVTHHFAQAKRLSHYLYFLYQGKLIEEGETETLFITPKTPLLQDYLLGRMIY